MLKKLTTFCVLALLSSCATNFKDQEVKIEEIAYSTQNTQLKGFLYQPKNKKSKGGVLVIHEWYGLNEYAQKRAFQLAEQGYTTFAIDMYGAGKVATHPKDAKAFMMESLKDPAEIKRKFEAAINVLTEKGGADKNKVAAVGYCFGGAIALNMARAGIDLAAVASFHGSLGTNNKAKKGVIKGEILVGNGGADPMVPAKDVADFMQEMNTAEVDVEFLNFKGALHAFTVVGSEKTGKKYGLPLAYDKEADERSWSALQALLKRNL